LSFKDQLFRGTFHVNIITVSSNEGTAPTRSVAEEHIFGAFANTSSTSATY
jgi:hypothetical protein